MTSPTYAIIDFDPEVFLRQYWQKKPCVIKNLFPAFADPLDANTLASLALEEDIDSRIVSRIGDDWQVTQGPFDESDINSHCSGFWTLMVQGVDNFIPEVQFLTKRFNFIPRWRFDDLLVTYSVPGAGVGAHFDEYDVFIVQGQGQRRWQVGQKVSPNNENIYPHPKLQQVGEFSSIIDVITMPGDVLYIPPMFPHKGETIQDCINYSVGFRAPNQNELIQALADGMLQREYESVRFSDVGRELSTRHAAISGQDIVHLKTLIQQFVDSNNTDKLLLSMLSSGHPIVDSYALSDAYDDNDLLRGINTGIQVSKNLGVKTIYADEQDTEDFVFYINGQEFQVEAYDRPFFQDLLDKEAMFITADDNLQHSSITTLTTIINCGYFEIID